MVPGSSAVSRERLPAVRRRRRPRSPRGSITPVPGGRRRRRSDMTGEGDRTRDDERLLVRAEEALTEIKVSKGLSEPHAAVLAALRIRLKGDPGKNLDDLMAAAGDLEGPTLDDAFEPSQATPSPSIADLISKAEKPKRSLDDLLGLRHKGPAPRRGR